MYCRKRKLNDCKKHTVRQDYLEDLVIQEIHRFFCKKDFLRMCLLQWLKNIINSSQITLKLH